MKIFIIRHADAIEYETDTVKNDELRFITPKGRKVTGRVANALKEEFNGLQKIFTSPLIRAVQTAEIIAAELKFKNDIELVYELRNEVPIAALQKLLNENSGLDSIALVSHEPKVSLLVKSFSDKKNFEGFCKSSVCLIEFDPESGEGKFKWYFDSKTMEFKK
jgi:phosphohistidine phosphatase